MKSALLKMLALLLLTDLSSHATTSTVIKITEDPFSAGVLAAEKKDPRLAQNLTYEANRKTVSSILDELKKQTDIKFYSGYNSNDWQVRDRKMNIIVKDLPLSNLMESMSRVMKFKWNRRKLDDGEYTYRLYMDRKAILEGEARLLREEQKRSENRSDFVEFCLDTPDLSEVEMDRLKEEDPARYLLIKSGVSGALGDFLREAPDAALALQSGSVVNLDASVLSPSCQQALSRLIQGIQYLSSAEPLGPTRIPEDISHARVRVNRPSVSSRPSFVLGVIIVQDDSGDSVGLPIIDTNCEAMKSSAKAQIAALEGGRKMTETELRKENDLFFAAATRSESAEPIAEHPDDPLLENLIAMPDMSGKLTDILSKVGEASQICIVSDSFNSSDGPVSVRSGKVKLKGLLDGIVAQCSYNWIKPGQVIEFQDRFWAKHRAAQIPEIWIDEWRQAIRKTGTLDIDQLSQIAMLTPAQLWENVADDEILGSNLIIPLITSNQDILKAYGMFSSSERQALFSENGLDLRHLSGALPEFLWAKATASPDADTQLRLLASRRQVGNLFQYTFTLVADQQTMKWSFTTPEYKSKDSKMPENRS